MKETMQQITVDEMKKIELDILRDVAKFCEKNNLRYYLCGGTLIGAIRHKGFIPWDDDIDIVMPRPDYMKFVNLYNQKQTQRYTVHSIFNDNSFWRAFAQVFDNRTMMYERNLNSKYAEHPISIDVFPMDGVPENKVIWNVIIYVQKVLHVIYYSGITDYQPSKHFDNKVGALTTIKNRLRTILKYMSIAILGKIPANKTVKLINNITMHWKFEESKHVAGYIEMTYDCNKEVNDRCDFEQFIIGEFEGSKFHIPVGYDKYLRKLHGDYMKLPPVNKRVSIHSFNGYWKDSTRQGN